MNSAGLTMFNREAADDPTIVDEWGGGFGWFAHPEEGENARATRSSSMMASGSSIRFSQTGSTGGSLDWETLSGSRSVRASIRDADIFTERYDVPIYIPEKMSRIAERIDGPIRRYESDLDDAGVRMFHRYPFPRADEAILFHERNGTLYVPDALGTTPRHTVSDERIGLEAFTRLFPPTELLGVDPVRICCGHGEGIFEDASSALEDAINGGRRRFPRAVVAHSPARIRTIATALRG